MRSLSFSFVRAYPVILISVSFFLMISVQLEQLSLWYRFASKKLSCQVSLSRLQTHPFSPNYYFCSALTENLQHFLVRRPSKWILWTEVLAHFSPHLSFSQDDICSIVWSLKSFPLVDQNELWILTLIIYYPRYTSSYVTFQISTKVIKSLKRPMKVHGIPILTFYFQA